MKKKNKYGTKTKSSTIDEPLAKYNTKRISFSTLETQNDIQLKYAMSISGVERLKLMRKINDYAYKNIVPEKILICNAKLIFSSYEYIPG